MNAVVKELELINSLIEELKNLSELADKYSIFCYDEKTDNETCLYLLSYLTHIQTLLGDRKYSLETENGK